MPSITAVIQENLHWTLAMSRMNGVQVPNGISPEDLLAYCQSRAHMFERDDWADERFTPGRAMLLNIRFNFQTLFCLRYLMRIRRWNNLTWRVLRQYQIRHSRALNAFVASISEFVNWATMLHYYLTHDESIVLELTGFLDFEVIQTVHYLFPIQTQVHVASPTIELIGKLQRSAKLVGINLDLFY